MKLFAAILAAASAVNVEEEAAVAAPTPTSVDTELAEAPSHTLAEEDHEAILAQASNAAEGRRCRYLRDKERRIQILDATYGAQDVTKKIVDLYRNYGQRKFIADNKVFGDPLPGLKKCLSITYKEECRPR